MRYILFAESYLVTLYQRLIIQISRNNKGVAPQEQTGLIKLEEDRPKAHTFGHQHVHFNKLRLLSPDGVEMGPNPSTTNNNHPKCTGTFPETGLEHKS